MSNGYIAFEKKSKDSVEPIPSHKSLPGWFKRLPSRVDDIPAVANATAKLCMPFNDALRIGWLLRSPVDLQVDTTGGETNIEGDTQGVSVVDNDTSCTEVCNSTFKQPNVIIDCDWGIRTPDGHLSLLVDPMNRDDTRYRAAGQVIQTDRIDMEKTRVPIVVEKGTEITISRGDPLTQLLPLERECLLDGFDVKISDGSDGFVEVASAFSNNVHQKSGYYRRWCWVKKSDSTINDREEVEGEEDLTVSDCDSTDDTYPIERPLTFLDEAYEGAIPEPEKSEIYKSEVNYEGLPEKICERMYNAMEVGIVATANGDINVSMSDGEMEASTGGSEKGVHSQEQAKIGVDHPLAPTNLLNVHNKWWVATPDGCSVLITSPLNHFQEYYTSYSGLVDTDGFISSLNAPGRYRSSEEHTLENGFPVAQVLPINREKLITDAIIEEDIDE